MWSSGTLHAMLISSRFWTKPGASEVGDGYPTFTVNGELSPEALTARAPVAHDTL